MNALEYAPLRKFSLLQALRARFDPRSAGLACLFTAATFLLLPYMEMISAKRADAVELRRVDTIPAPPPPPIEDIVEEREPVSANSLPRPKLAREKKRIAPMSVMAELAMNMGEMDGAFGLDFAVSDTGIEGAFGKGVFELSDLDTEPQPLARMRPVYPPAARIRGIEGFVEVVFVVQADGRVGDVKIAGAEPKGEFERTTLRTVRNWRFKPGMLRGVAVPVRVRQRIAFELE